MGHHKIDFETNSIESLTGHPPYIPTTHVSFYLVVVDCNMASTESADTLGSLPAEIIHSILDWVALERPPIGETRPVRYDSLIPGEDWHTFTRNRRALASLCLTSKKFAQYAQPLLYKTVPILDETSLVLFFRTIAENPALRPLVRFFSCHLTLTRPPVARNVREALEVHCRRSDDYASKVYRFDQIGDRTPEGVVSFILLHLPRLETVLLQVPICDDFEDYTTLVSDLVIARDRFPDSPIPPSLNFSHDYDLQFAPIPTPPETPFMHLETMMLQGDPEMREYFENEGCDEVPETWGAALLRYTPMYWISPKLTTLEVSSDDGNFDFRQLGYYGRERKLEHYIGNLRHVYLHDSIANPRNLHHILRHAPLLETLYMTPRLDDGMGYEWDLPDLDSTAAHPESLDVALTKYAKNLRHLDVGWFEVFGRGTLIGEDGRLAALPMLKKLEKLCIQLSVLYGSDVALVPLANLLPPNLVELTLEDWWWTDIDAYDEMQGWTAEDKLDHYRSKKDYRANALNSLIQFAADSKAAQPKLQKVLLLCHIPWTWMMEAGVELDFHFGEVKEAFGKRGVEFLVEEA